MRRLVAVAWACFVAGTAVLPGFDVQTSRSDDGRLGFFGGDLYHPAPRGGGLGISEATVKSHVNAIVAKLEAKDRTDALMIALKRGLIR